MYVIIYLSPETVPSQRRMRGGVRILTSVMVPEGLRTRLRGRESVAWLGQFSSVGVSGTRYTAFSSQSSSLIESMSHSSPILAGCRRKREDKKEVGWGIKYSCDMLRYTERLKR